MKRARSWRATLASAGAAAAMVCAAGSMTDDASAQEPLAPADARRGEDQTFLTFPEWFLVYSPAEYAALLRDRYPSEFPWWGHIGQVWSGYRDVIRATRRYAFNTEYHVMINVIAVSTTVEYALRSAYETLVGRLTELVAPAGGTDEDRFAAKAAQEYVDFIRVRPWYEFDFVARLRALSRDVPATGPGMLRKWERRYALTTEFAIKAAYGWLIGLGTQSAYGAASPVTVIVLDKAPASPLSLPDFKPQRTVDGGRVVATVPRYDAFKDYAAALADAGVEFQEIAGNGPKAPLLISVVAPAGWTPPAKTQTLFEQPIITASARKRVALVVPVAELSSTLRALRGGQVELEHVYDY